MHRRKKFYTSVTRRLFIIFFFLGLLPLLIFGWIVKDYLEEIYLARLEERVIATIEAQSEVLSSFLDNKIHLLNMLVRLLPRSYFELPENTDQLFLAITSESDFVDLHVMAADGRQYGYAGPYRSIVEGKDYAGAPWFHETLLSGVHISNVFTGYRNVPHFVVAVTDPLKNYVLRATINSSSFNAILRKIQLSPHSDAFIVNRAGEFQTPSLLGDTTPDAHSQTMLTGDSRKLYIQSQDNIYVGRWLADGRWLLIIKANIDDFFSSFIPIQTRIIFSVVTIFVLALLAATVASILFAHHLKRREEACAADSMHFAHMEKMATIGRLAAGVAHEINNPLQMISSQASWMADLLPEEDPSQVKNFSEYTDSVEKIRHHVRRAGTITHRLLGFSKKMAAQQDQVQINDLLAETCSFIEKEAEHTNIKIKREFSPNLPTTMTDGPQLQQVFLNLINNAMDAAGEGGYVLVRTMTGKRRTLVIEFADNGPGIPPENLKQIFDPFFTTKGPDKGTGLGLYISYDIIQKLGGSISVENRKEGGALFTVQLPINHLGQESANSPRK